jgi:hypothetical protein
MRVLASRRYDRGMARKNSGACPAAMDRRGVVKAKMMSIELRPLSD